MEWQCVLEFLHGKLRPLPLYSEVDETRNEYEIMSLIMSNIEVQEFLILWLKKQHELLIPKSKTEAKRLKEEGNELFKKKNYTKCVQLYTNSARYATSDNSDYGISVANRSAALFYMGEYKRCLEDIDVAFASNYPKELHPKLYLRAAQCWTKLYDVNQANEQLTKAQNLITNDEDVSTIDKDNALRHIAQIKMEIKEVLDEKISKVLEPDKWTPEDLLPLNPTYPSASTALIRKYLPTKGRHVIAKNDIRRGDVLYVEKPFAFVTLDHVIADKICTHCCRYFTEAAYPCRGCPHVSYCSEKCWSNSWPSYHKWECVGYEMNIWKQIGIAHLALRVLFSSIETLDNVKFNEVQKLVTNIDKLRTDDLIVYSITAMMLALYLDFYTDCFSTVDLKKCLVDKFTDEKVNISCDVSCHENKKIFVGSLLLRHMLQLIANGHAITRLNLTCAESENVFEEQQQRIAVGIYPSVSMMNHSCDPNIMNSFWNNYIIVKAIRDIPSGEEIFNCYGPHFRRMRLKERQEALKNQYCFKCQCEPCINPELRHFLECFNAFKCLNCNGALTQIDTNPVKCSNCNSTCTVDIKSRTDDLNNAESLFHSAQDFMHMGNNVKALNYFKRCLNIREKWLFMYHDEITNTYDALGKICTIMCRWYQSILYLEKSILAVEKKFGPDSIEVANEFNKITDVCIEYLQRTTNKKSSEYRNIVKKTELTLKRAKKIMIILQGSWSDNYQEISNKEQELSDMLQNLCL